MIRTVAPRHVNPVGNPGTPCAIRVASNVPASGSITSLTNSAPIATAFLAAPLS
jgi:hypothetical protein